MAGYALTTSTTTVDLIIGDITFTVDDVGDYQPGNRVRVTNNTTTYVEGLIITISGTDITVSVDFFMGTGTASTWTFSVSGIQSAVGATGTRGPMGASGATGLAGPIGSTGPQGIPGLPGSKGSVGNAGATGATGLVGAKGATGAQAPGIVGPRGPAGATGAPGTFAGRGATGSIGATGATGSGATGATGIQGATGPGAGSTGATGAAGFWTATEAIAPITGAAGVVVHDFTSATTFYHTGISANFTANFTNVPTAANQSVIMVVMIKQGATGYKITAAQIEGVVVPIVWLGGAVPIANANKLDVYSFGLLMVDSVWIVTGQCASYG